ncbi:MAG: hypothetical protein ACK5P7_13140 [Bdellovibrio sp.]|jgi:hypothetical protein
MSKLQQSTLAKALEINKNPQIYGAFAEIGAGQEVARFFFQAGHASQTIAKTISAYDMVYSDEIYGREESGRYVCESRLGKMLDKEFHLLHRRLDQTRGPQTSFFAFANTVATGDKKRRTCHGWMGIRFQKKPLGPHNDIVLHVRMLDKYRLQQQETLGVLGVNLTWAAFYASDKIETLVPALIDNIREGQMTIDMIRCTGPDLGHMNNHLLNLELVKRGLADAILFGPDESILSLGDTLFQKPLVIERGNFRPVTRTHVELLEKAKAQFQNEFPAVKEKPLALFELTMRSLKADGNVDEKDFLDRVRTLASTGHHVLVSNFFLFYRLKQFLRDSTGAPLALIMPANHLDRLFDPAHYKDLEGGLLEGMGKFLDPHTHLFVYPHKSKDLCTTAQSFFPEPALLPIYQYFRNQKWIVDLAGCAEADEYIHSEQVRQDILKKDKTWESLVPASVAALIKKDGLFGF